MMHSLTVLTFFVTIPALPSALDCALLGTLDGALGPLLAHLQDHTVRSTRATQLELRG